MAFVQAMDTQDLTKISVDGADVLTEKGVDDYRVSLFKMLNRGADHLYIDNYVTKVYNRNIPNEICDLFVMAFQTRDIRGGKGERRIFYYLIESIYRHDRDTVKQMLELIPEYGCWRDMWELLKRIPDLRSDILRITKEHFKEDMLKYDTCPFKMSLLAKWLPREGSGTYPELPKIIANYIYAFEPSERKRIVRYRKDTSMMNKALETVEINMCGKSWAKIKPESVPGRCLKIHKKAFFNESHNDTLRYPNSEDRMDCRKHFQEFIEALSKKVCGGANIEMPHELVVKALACYASINELEINQSHWDSIKEDALKLGGLGKCISMCDFSGSMNGLPKLISLAIGILISETSHIAFKDHILTFVTEPEWHSFAKMNTLKDKLDSIGDKLGQGQNTNFYKAAMKILEKMKQSKVPTGEEPEDLIVLTDMGFDAASKENKYGSSTTISTWDNEIEQIRNEFKKAGEEIWGEGNGWKAPRIVIWNLSYIYKDLYAKASQEGVVQLLGWNPSILKTLLNGCIQVISSYQEMRTILDNERYDEVRKVWNRA